MIGLTNLSTTSFDKRFLKKIAEFVLEKENKKGMDLSIVLVDKKKIRELNREYRKEDKATNVLSFCYEQGKPFVFPLKNLVKLGEIAICPEYIKEDAKKRGVDFKEEFARISIHGILHILGYNHKTERSLKKMNDLQEQYLSLYFNQQ
jgi:probable rRNA maturation factor